MKWIAALLLIVNVAVYLWAGGQNESGEQFSIHAEPDVNREGMLLLDEVQRGGSQLVVSAEADITALPVAKLDTRKIASIALDDSGEQVEPVAATVVAKELSPATQVEDGSVGGDLDADNVTASLAEQESAAVIAEPELLICFRIGPFMVGESWQAANEWMNEQDFAYRTVRSESRELRAVRVYLGPFESMEDTGPVISQLKAKQLDHFPYPREDGKARISLGYFTQEELANKFVEHLLTRGIEAKTEAKFRTLGPFEWMEASIDSRRQTLLLTRQWEDSEASVNPVECSSISAASG